MDEIHAVLESRRGAHLALTLERLAHVAQQPLQRIGLSATMEPIEEVGMADWAASETEAAKRRARADAPRSSIKAIGASWTSRSKCLVHPSRR